MRDVLAARRHRRDFKRLYGEHPLGDTTTPSAVLHTPGIAEKVTEYSGYGIALMSRGLYVVSQLLATEFPWRFGFARLEVTMHGDGYTVTALAVLGEGRFASGSLDTTVKIWDAAAARCLATLQGHSEGVLALEELGAGRLASGSQDKTIKIWCVDVPRRCVATLQGHDGSVFALAKLGECRLASGSTKRSLNALINIFFYNLNIRQESF